MIFNTFHGFIFAFLLLIPVHEFGHYLAAKREGIYKGWGLFPQPHIKLTQHFGSRWGYLSGLAASLFLYPYWHLTQPPGSWYMFLSFILAAACFDLPIFIFYDKIMERRKKKAAQHNNCSPS